MESHAAATKRKRSEEPAAKVNFAATSSDRRPTSRKKIPEDDGGSDGAAAVAPAAPASAASAASTAAPTSEVSAAGAAALRRVNTDELVHRTGGIPSYMIRKARVVLGIASAAEDQVDTIMTWVHANLDQPDEFWLTEADAARIEKEKAAQGAEAARVRALGRLSAANLQSLGMSERDAAAISAPPEPAGPPPAQINANRKSAKQQWGAVRGALQSMRVMKAATKASATVAERAATISPIGCAAISKDDHLFFKAVNKTLHEQLAAIEGTSEWLASLQTDDFVDANVSMACHPSTGRPLFDSEGDRNKPRWVQGVVERMKPQLRVRIDAATLPECEAFNLPKWIPQSVRVSETGAGPSQDFRIVCFKSDFDSYDGKTCLHVSSQWTDHVNVEGLYVTSPLNQYSSKETVFQTMVLINSCDGAGPGRGAKRPPRLQP